VSAPLPDELLAALRQVLPAEGGPYPLHEPRFAGREWEYVKQCLDSGWVSSAGTFVERFERELAHCTSARHAVATVNGTAALHLCCLAAGVKPGDEVVVPTLSFVATANAVCHAGATPRFADCEPETLGLDPDKLRDHLRSAKVAAVVCTHVFGHPARLEDLGSVCAERGVPLIEDAAEALGSRVGGRHVGTTGLCAALSFNGNKIVTTGGGGAVLTDDADLAGRVRHWSTTAKKPHPWRFDHDAVGYNYRMPNLNAALGCAQLEQLQGFLEAKRRLADRYGKALAPVRGAGLFAPPHGAESNHWLSALLLERADAAARDAVLETLHGAGILARPAWTLLHRLPMYAGAPRMEDLSAAEDLEARLICLPSSAHLA
jgi:perosamine synthetase